MLPQKIVPLSLPTDFFYFEIGVLASIHAANSLTQGSDESYSKYSLHPFLSTKFQVSYNWAENRPIHL